jgi:hypothetical protein
LLAITNPVAHQHVADQVQAHLAPLPVEKTE